MGALRQGDRTSEHVVRLEAVGGRVGHVPDASHLSPAVVVAGPGDEQVVPGGQLQDVAAGGRGEGEPLGGAVHDFEAVHPRRDERLQVLAMVLPVFRERGDGERPLPVQLSEQPQHRRGVPGKAVPVDGPNLAQRHHMLAVHAPLHSREQPDRQVARRGQWRIGDIVVGHI